ncbi:MAG: histidine kinase N-terminal 7TM domain-containing protein [Candidatus Margulisbacteria bacterium]|nr:histidine kinase N-terminal 7TM domain-containing protein [Candidatus Margulisiibacteriota bacterium]
MAVNLGLGIYIYIKNSRSQVNQTFSALLVVIALWTFTFLALVSAGSPETALFWRRLTPVGSSLAASLFLYFSLIFPTRLPKVSALNLPLIFSPGVFFAIASVFFDEMIRGIAFTDAAQPFLARPIFGWLYNFYTLYLLLYFLGGLGVLSYKYFKGQPQERSQIVWVLGGLGGSVLAVITTSLILPVFGVSNLFIFGPAFTLIAAFFISYAIARYQLLGVEEFLSSGVLVIGITLAIVGTIACFAFALYGLLLPLYTILANLTLGLLVFFND